MQRCIDLARLGLGLVAPNPLVGSVVVYNGMIIGEGYHRKSGEAHAEALAIGSVHDHSLLPHSSLYVNLEPCSHQGKTPPCSDLILAKRIPRVVLGTVDPNPLVMGKGIEKLRAGGCQVHAGCLSEESRFLNRRFFTFHEKARPYIILKWAQSADRFLDIVRNETHHLLSTWITGEPERQLVHKWRSEEQAIMVGTNTALKDNPKLNVRSWTGKNPVRLIPDRNLRLSPDLNIFDSTVETWIFNEQKNQRIKNTEWIPTHFGPSSLKNILRILHSRGIQSVLVEGGFELLDSFIKDKLWDEARIFTGQKHFYQGIPSPAIDGLSALSQSFEKSRLELFYNSCSSGI